MNKLILAIDNNQDILDLLEVVLVDEGYEVVTHFHELDIELELIKRLMPGLIILDLIWGRQDLGWKLIQEIKTEHITTNIPIILLTTESGRVRDLEKVLLEKAITVLLKPFDIYELLAVVKSTYEGFGLSEPIDIQALSYQRKRA